MTKKEELALYGGNKAKTVPYGTGRRFGETELKELKEALDQNTLFYWSGQKSKALFKKFAEMYGMKYCTGASSGTAAIHCALGAVGVTAGDEVITSPITDMGSIIGILFQNAVPVFADVEPHTYNMSPKSIREKITSKTKVIVVVHLAGNPADMDAINKTAKEKGIAVIEDCAQSYLAYYKGVLTGTLGDIGCFSLNDFKHISAGDGGLCVTNDEVYYKKLFRFADKNYNRFGGNMREVPYIAPNYRINELTSAVAIAQLDRLGFICGNRNRYGNALAEGINDLEGIDIPEITYAAEGSKSSYWFFMLRINEKARFSREEFCRALSAEGVPNQPGYIPACVYEYDLFKNLSAYTGSDCPFNCPKFGVPGRYKYEKGLCPEAEAVLKTAVRLNVNEFFTETDLRETISAIRKVYDYLQGTERSVL